MEERVESPSISILDYLGEVEDPRKSINRKYRIDEILFVSLCAMLAGAEGYTDMESFGQSRKDWFCKHLPFKEGIPSHDTIRRLFCLLDGQSFLQTLVNWTESIRDNVSAEVVAIDGKSLRRTGKTKDKILHVVNAWAARNRMVLGQLKVDGKSNEITAIPELIGMLELSGCIVTLDAMGTQKNIAKEIHEADADYVLCLKDNHPTAYEEITSFLDDAIEKAEDHLSYDEDYDKGHRRIETRKAWITENIQWFADRKEWENLRSVGIIESTRDINGEKTVQRRYYLSSLPADAKVFSKAVRTHWRVENSLHWVLDVSLNEDQSRARTENAAQNLSLLRKWCINLFHQPIEHPVKSIRARQKMAAWDMNYLVKLLSASTKFA